MDVTPGPLEELRQRGISAYCADERTIFDHIDRQSIGVIHMNHVIEHLPNARATMEALFEALVPGGALIGQTPNTASFGNRFWGDSWNQWHVPRHLVLFDMQTLSRLAESVGFEVVSVESSISGATQWALSGLYWWAKKRGRQFWSTHESLYPPLILACLPIAVLESWFSQTCHMDFVFRRPE